MDGVANLLPVKHSTDGVTEHPDEGSEDTTLPAHSFSPSLIKDLFQREKSCNNFVNIGSVEFTLVTDYPLKTPATPLSTMARYGEGGHSVLLELLVARLGLTASPEKEAKAAWFSRSVQCSLTEG